MTELWANVPGLEPWRASTIGRIMHGAELMTYTIDNNGYQWVSKDGFNSTVHYLVARTWCGYVPAGYEIHHVNENKRDNRSSNLLIVSHAEHEAIHGFSFRQLSTSVTNVIDVEPRYKAVLPDVTIKDKESTATSQDVSDDAIENAISELLIDQELVMSDIVRKLDMCKFVQYSRIMAIVLTMTRKGVLRSRKVDRRKHIYTRSTK